MKPYVPLPLPETDDIDTLRAWSQAEHARWRAHWEWHERHLERLGAVNGFLWIAVPTLIFALALWWAAHRQWMWAGVEVLIGVTQVAVTRRQSRRIARKRDEALALIAEADALRAHRTALLNGDDA